MGRTDGGTDGQPENIMPPATLLRRHNNKGCYLKNKTFMMRYMNIEVKESCLNNEHKIDEIRNLNSQFYIAVFNLKPLIHKVNLQ